LAFVVEITVNQDDSSLFFDRNLAYKSLNVFIMLLKKNISRLFYKWLSLTVY